MATLRIEGLPASMTKGSILRWLLETTELRKEKVGKIDVHASRVLIEVPDHDVTRLARVLSGLRVEERVIAVFQQSAASENQAVEAHFNHLDKLLTWEAREESRRAREQGRDLLAGLMIGSTEPAMGGRLELEFSMPGSRPLPEHPLDAGDPVWLLPRSPRALEMVRGVVSRIDRSAIRVMVDDLPDEVEGVESWRLRPGSDDVSRQRQRDAMNVARSARDNRLAELRDALLAHSTTAHSTTAHSTTAHSTTTWAEAADVMIPPQRASVTSWFNPALNETQRQAILASIEASDVAVIHGPPGTGKTTTLVELIRQLVERGERVLACAPSNLGVDNLLAPLVRAGVSVVRLGHPARVHSDLLDVVLEKRVSEHELCRQAGKLTKEAWRLFDRAGKWTRAKPTPGERDEQRQQARGLLDEARRLERRAIEHVLDDSAVVAATTTGLDPSRLGGRTFDVLVIDESAQATEPACWPALARARKVILAGDHCQLPPTVVSKEAEAHGLAVSLMERLLRDRDDVAYRRLEVQYRMNESIAAFSSRAFYEGAVKADDTVARRRFVELPGVRETPWTNCPLIFLDTAGSGYHERDEASGTSHDNPGEAELSAWLIGTLLDAGARGRDIGVITPYSAQAKLIRDLLASRQEDNEIEVNSVDGFQGREKEAIILSLVRSNTQGEVGFLGEARRLNVAMTRARRLLVIIADASTLARDPFLASLIEHCEASGAYRSVWNIDREMT